MKNYVGRVTLTREDLERASTYIPILDKTVLAKQMADACVERVSVAVPMREESLGVIPVPELYQEAPLHRSLCTQFVLLYFYLKMPDITAQYDPNGEAKLAANDYDRYGGILCQLDRMKSDREVRDKVFALLADYKDFEKRLGAEIHNLLAIQNDVCTRITSMLLMQTDPKSIQDALRTTDDLARQAKERGKQLQGDAVELAKKAAKKRALEARMNETVRKETP